MRELVTLAEVLARKKALEDEAAIASGSDRALLMSEIRMLEALAEIKRQSRTNDPANKP